MLQFFTPEGQELEMIDREYVSTPSIVTRAQGVFLTYSDIMEFQQKMLWLDEEGTIDRELTLDLQGVGYAYAEGSSVTLVSVATESHSGTRTFSAHTFGEDGSRLYSDTLLVTTLLAGEGFGGYAFRHTGSTLTFVSAMVRDEVQPLEYTVRIGRYAGRTSNVSYPWSPGSLPDSSYIMGWNIAPAWGDHEILSFYIIGRTTPEIRLQPFGREGESNGSVQAITLWPDYTPNGLDVLVESGSVYAVFSQQAVELPGGIYLTAFPLANILDASDREGAPVPNELQLTAYPNPFNSQVNLEYAIPFNGSTSLQIFDLTGRIVSELPLAGRDATRGVWRWNAREYPTGTYLVRLSNHEAAITRKLFLIR